MIYQISLSFSVLIIYEFGIASFVRNIKESVSITILINSLPSIFFNKFFTAILYPRPTLRLLTAVPMHYLCTQS